MPDITYVDLAGPVVSAAWLNQVNRLVNDLPSSGGGLGAALIGRGLPVVDSIAALRTLLTTSAAKRAFVTGYYAAGDGGGGPYYYDAADTTSTDNGGTVIVAADGGRWKLVYGESISPTQFGADRTGATDCTTAFANFRAFLAANVARVKGIFPAGVYQYSVSPNWAITNVVILAAGEVRLRYSGTGNAVILDAGANTYNVTFGSPDSKFIVEAPATAQNGVYARRVHHSRIAVNVRGCGATYSALRIEFAVCSQYWFTASVNEGAWYTGAKPKYGIYCTRDGASEDTSACTFHNPVIEGVLTDGMYLDYAVMNTVVGGTSEACGGIGVRCTANSRYNTFQNLDMEVNTGGDISDSGRSNVFDQCLSDTSAYLSPTSVNPEIRAGSYNSVTVQGNGAKLLGFSYGSNAGTLDDTGTNTEKYAVYNLNSAKFDRDKPRGSLLASPSCATGVATNAITLPTTGTNWYHVTAAIPGAGDTQYGAYALVFQDGASTRIVTQTNGTLMTITLVAGVLKVTQTSGATTSVTVQATSF